MEPYYNKDGITIYHGDCRDVVPEIGRPGLILADPPYGISHPGDFHKRGRDKLAKCNDYPDVHGDSERFDPSWLLALHVPCCLFGANHYAQSLPPSTGWIVWDKMRPAELDQSTAELAWTDFLRGVRVFRHHWDGMMTDSERGERYHPTQKPVALFKWILCHKWTPTVGVVLDPYMGSGPVLIACKDAGRHAIGIEIEERYCEIAAKRLRQSVMQW
jgi:DNA modification methylase